MELPKLYGLPQQNLRRSSRALLWWTREIPSSLHSGTKLGHLGFEMVRKLMGFSRELKAPPCSSCTITKAQRQPLPRQSLTKYANVGDCIHSDAMVLRLPTIGGAKNCVTFIDHKSRFGRIYLV